MLKIKSSVLLSSLTISAVVLSGCAKQPVVNYNPDDFSQPTRVETKEIKVPALPQNVESTYGIGNDPAVVKAYEKYLTTGQAESVQSDGWHTVPYSPNTKQYIQCQPLNMCVIQLQTGEQLLSVNAGDTVRWKIGQFATGAGANTAVSITAKPTKENIATDLILSTDKRNYFVSLVSEKGAGSSVLRYYYPQETAINAVLNAQKYQQEQFNKRNGVVSSNSSAASAGETVIAQGTNLGSINAMNFNYKIKGDSPVWRPLRIFDDGSKTFIQLPNLTDKFQLPVLYLAKGKELQLVNYRYKKPYFIVDGLFSRAWLVDGKGSDQVRVEILNENIK